MAQLTDGFKDIFLAGIGALAITGEKAKDVVDQLIEKGELTVEQGKQVNRELTHKAVCAAEAMNADAIEAMMRAMSPEQRAAFAERVSRVAAQVDAIVESDDALTEDVPVADAEPAEADPEASDAKPEAAQ